MHNAIYYVDTTYIVNIHYCDTHVSFHIHIHRCVFISAHRITFIGGAKYIILEEANIYHSKSTVTSNTKVSSQVI